MKTIGPLYADTMKYSSYFKTKLFPIVEPGWTQETEEPFRKGKCLVFRFPFTTPGFIVGLFKHSGLGEQEALMNAMNAREVLLSKWEEEGIDV